MIDIYPAVAFVATKTAETNPETLPLAGFIGLIAPIALLAGYGLLTAGKLTAKHYTYQWLNAIGAAALTYTVVYPWNGGVFITEFLWTLIALFGVWKIWKERKDSANAPGRKPRVK